MQSPELIWTYSSGHSENYMIKHDHSWLISYDEILTDKKILELGCGSGIDTAVLSGYAESLVSGDLAPKSDSQGTVLALDHSQELPFKNGTFDIVVASLCLHYFRVLKSQGVFICRLNSYKDQNYGAVGYPEIESGLYNVDGEQKRFFQEHEIQSLWAQGYSLTAISHNSIDRYQKVKWVYEFSAVRL